MHPVTKINMGYYTKFDLTIHEGVVNLQEVKTALDGIMGNSASNFILDADLIFGDDTMTWYKHDEDCATLSLKFPGVVFKLHGDGEESGDQWNSYYKDGLCQICRIVPAYPDYDPKKLKSVQEAQKNDLGR